MNRLVGVLVGIGVIVALKFGLPSLWVAAESAIGHGWDDARPELLAKNKASVAENLALFDIDDSVKQELAECVTDRTIEFLNTTDCTYRYNPSTTNEQEHLREQEACFERAGVRQKEEEFDIQCSRQVFPNDWSIIRPVLHRDFTSGFVAQGTEKAAAERSATCVSSKAIELLGASDCPLINLDPTQKLMNTVDDCLQRPELAPRFEAAVASCADPGIGSVP